MGNGVSLPPKLRPVFLQRLEEIRARRHVAQLKGSTPSKKEPLLHDDDIINAYDQDSTHHEPSSKEGSDRVRPRQETLYNEYDEKRHEVAKEDLKMIEKGVQDHHHENTEENLTDYEDAEDDGNDDDKRRIGYDGDDAFPGSPSFRVYFQDDGNKNPNGNNNNGFGDHKAPSDDSAKPQDSGPSKKMKKGRKRKSFKMVFSKGGPATVKNLLNVTSCCTSPDNHRQARINTEKSDP